MRRARVRCALGACVALEVVNGILSGKCIVPREFGLSLSGRVVFSVAVSDRCRSFAAAAIHKREGEKKKLLAHACAHGSGS
uniref:Putative secreted protein n=1 Tax=Anopheles darlingi TaxID=43151 RepID=A0A2M4D5H8_ANODA